MVMLTLVQIHRIQYSYQQDQIDSYSDVAIGSNTSYSDARIGDKIWHQHTHP